MIEIMIKNIHQGHFVNASYISHNKNIVTTTCHINDVDHTVSFKLLSSYSRENFIRSLRKNGGIILKTLGYISHPSKTNISAYSDGIGYIHTHHYLYSFLKRIPVRYIIIEPYFNSDYDIFEIILEPFGLQKGFGYYITRNCEENQTLEMAMMKYKLRY